MTLDTRIYVHTPVDVHELFREGQRLLHLCYLDEGSEDRTPERQRFRDEESGWGRYVGAWSIFNEIGQGLPAILDVTYRPDAPLKATAAECDRWCSDPCDRESPHRPAHWCEISLDTAYSYSTAIGSCTDLHVVLIRAFAQWLDARGASFSWQNEYTGEIHDGLSGLEDFASDGRKADAWFRDTVVPAIERLT